MGQTQTIGKGIIWLSLQIRIWGIQEEKGWIRGIIRENWKKKEEEERRKRDFKTWERKGDKTKQIQGQSWRTFIIKEGLKVQRQSQERSLQRKARKVKEGWIKGQMIHSHINYLIKFQISRLLFWNHVHKYHHFALISKVILEGGLGGFPWLQYDGSLNKINSNWK